MDTNINVSIADIYYLLLENQQLHDTAQFDELREKLLSYVSDKSADDINEFDDALVTLVDAERANGFNAGFKAAFSLIKKINN